MPDPLKIHAFLCSEIPSQTCFSCEIDIEGMTYYHWRTLKLSLCMVCVIDFYNVIHGIAPSNKIDVRSTIPYKKDPIPNEIKWMIWERDNFTCQYCGVRKNLAVDHIAPESAGGTLDPSNLVTACTKCNSKKGARTPEQANMQLLKDPREF